MADDPDFERPEDHQFTVNEEVYVLDENDFDIFQAVIEEVEEDGYRVHYPEWPDDDATVSEDRLLPITDRNRAIFEEQERIRQERERKEEERKQRRKEKRKEKQKEKPPKEPKPPKEKKPRQKGKRQTAKPKTVDQIKKAMAGILRSARMKGFKTIEEFEEWLDRTYENDQVATENRQRLISRFERFVDNPARNQDEVVEDSYSDGMGYDSDSEEIVRYTDPEEIRVPDPKGDPVDGGILKLPSSVPFSPSGLVPKSDNREDMSIQFDRNGCANCFIYKTATDEWLILNGMKCRLKYTGQRPSEDVLFEEMRVHPVHNAQSTTVLYPALRVKEDVQLLPPADLFLTVQKKDRRNIIDEAALDRGDSVVQVKRRSRARDGDSYQQLEDSDSDD